LNFDVMVESSDPMVLIPWRVWAQVAERVAGGVAADAAAHSWRGRQFPLTPRFAKPTEWSGLPAATCSGPGSATAQVAKTEKLGAISPGYIKIFDVASNK
jgi:hypothetical protein